MIFWDWIYSAIVFGSSCSVPQFRKVSECSTIITMFWLTHRRASKNKLFEWSSYSFSKLSFQLQRLERGTTNISVVIPFVISLRYASFHIIVSSFSKYPIPKLLNFENRKSTCLKNVTFVHSLAAVVIYFMTWNKFSTAYLSSFVSTWLLGLLTWKCLSVIPAHKTSSK